MGGLSQSWIAVPIVSTAAVEPMLKLNQEDEDAPVVDNVLLEWIAALELEARGDLQAIIPVIACDDEGNAFSFSLPKDLSGCVECFWSTLFCCPRGPTMTTENKKKI
eukprot:COSAG01_NODE_10699_length_2102_cov_1.269096_2_plen_107_part_00